MKKEGGVTLVELMIAVALIGIGILGSIGTFNIIQRAITASKASTLATNLAQEKMQIIMQKSYFEILVTTTPVYDTDFNPSFAYDNGYFPPESILQGSIYFTRMTYVQVVKENASGSGSGPLQALSPSTPDTGMRQITVNVVWNSPSGKQVVTLQSVVNNPSTVMSDAKITGTVTDAVTASPIASALVAVAENVGWRDSTTNTGSYTLNMSPGSFHIVASALGYYPANVLYSVSPPPTSNPNQNFALTAISSGTVTGTAWINSHLLISQVVASTGPANSIEYVELYNPTTNAYVLGSNANPLNPNFWPVIWDKNNIASQRQLFYVNTTIPSYGYYLISNTGQPSDPATSCSAFAVAGVIRNPDACWLHALMPGHAIECNTSPCPLGGTASSPDAGGVSLFDSGGTTGHRIDSVGWAQSSVGDAAPASAVEGTQILPVSGGGLAVGEQFVRKSDTGTVNALYGRAYNASINSTDFLDNLPIVIAPNTTGTAPQTPVSGAPATGANVSVTDGLSTSVKATLAGNPPYAQFIVPGVATGTWTAFVDSGTSSAEIDNISVVASGGSYGIPNAGTSPVWPGVGETAVVLSTSGVTGIVSGYITDVYGDPPAAWSPVGVSVGIAGQTYPVASVNGHFSVRLQTGTYDVTANPNLGNGAYETQTQTGILIPNVGDETANVNFQLSHGGRLSGWITRDGTNPLPGVSVTAQDADGITHDTEVSANNGSFTLINLTTGTYTVSPVLDPKEIAIPASSTMTVVAGTTLSVGTFTVVGAMGTVTGNVTSSGHAIQTGVLVIISTVAFVTPPAISSNTLTSAAYYEGSSQEDGTYSVQVRGSTSSVYNIMGYYMYTNNQTPVISTKTIANVTVTAGQTTSGKNLAW